MSVCVCPCAHVGVQPKLLYIYKILVNKYVYGNKKFILQGKEEHQFLEDEEGNVCCVGMITLLIVLLLGGM